MSKNNEHDASSVCRDAFAILSGVTRIEYRDGEVWELEDDDTEHPLVPRLRAATVQALIEEPSDPTVGIDLHTELQNQLKTERTSNDKMRTFLSNLQDICDEAGMPKEVKGGDVLGWIKSRLNG